MTAKIIKNVILIPYAMVPQLFLSILSIDEISKGWNCHPNDVYVTHGVTEALQIIFSAVLSEGDRILAPGPHYPPYMAYPQMS